MSLADDVTWIDGRVERGVVVLEILESHLDPKTHTREDYHRVLDAAIEQGHRRVVLNLAKVDSENHSWGMLQLIFIANGKLKEAGGTLALCSLTRPAKKVLRTASLDGLCEQYKDEKAAIAAMA